MSYNWLLFKCFDTCIPDFENKSIDKNESDCIKECSANLRDAPKIFDHGHSFKGF
mgnify:CR=1 FL=1